MKPIDLEQEAPDYSGDSPVKPMRKVYPYVSFMHELHSGLKVGDEFEAVVRFRVDGITKSSSDDWTMPYPVSPGMGSPVKNEKVHTQTRLSMLSIAPEDLDEVTAPREEKFQSAIERALREHKENGDQGE